MKRDWFGACVAAVLTMSLWTNSNAGEQRLKEQLVGTWTAVSWEQKKNDGTRLQQFGANPAGIAFFDAHGRYIISVMRTDRARYASNMLWQGTAEEHKATAEGTMTYFGTYAVSASDSIAIHVEGSSYPNWNGTYQTRFVAFDADRLKLTIRPPSGENVDIIWKRTKQDTE